MGADLPCMAVLWLWIASGMLNRACSALYRSSMSDDKGAADLGHCLMQQQIDGRDKLVPCFPFVLDLAA